MILSINQPAYLPWLGYFDRIARADLHVVLDHVQFEKNSFTNRNKILMANGPAWLTVPVLTSGKFGDMPIHAIEIDNKIHWQRKHFRSLEQAYQKSPFWDKYAQHLQEYYQGPYQKLIDILSLLTQYFLNELTITTKVVSSSQHEFVCKKSDLVLEICSHFGASTYLSGPLGRQYLDESKFAKQGINIVYHDYVSPVYRQRSDEYFPDLSVVDLLFNHGPASLGILKGEGI